MSFFGEDFEEIDLNEEMSMASTSRLSQYPRGHLKLEKKVNIPILNKTTADPNTFEYEGLLKQINIHQTHFLDSNFIKTPSPRSDARTTVERLIFNHQLSENRKQFLRKEKEVNELKSCTFSPQLYTSKTKLKKSNSERQQLNKESEISSRLSLESEVANKANSNSPFDRSMANKCSSANILKSHSQEHLNTKSVILTPRKPIIAHEGRPPIPKVKSYK